MSEPKFTPGPLRVQLPTKWPWCIEILDSTDRVVFSDGMYCYSTADETFEDTMSAASLMGGREEAAKANEECLANAYLRAAAPDLYAALDELVSTIIIDDEEGLATFLDPIQRAQAALAKARGE